MSAGEMETLIVVALDQDLVGSEDATEVEPDETATGAAGLATNSSYKEEYDAIHDYFKEHGLKKYQQDATGMYVCHFCDTKLRGKCEVRRHLYVVHMSTRPFACDVCQKTFKIKHQLEEHMRTHRAGIYKCDHCDERFARRVLLNAHTKTHTGVGARNGPRQAKGRKRSAPADMDPVTETRSEADEIASDVILNLQAGQDPLEANEAVNVIDDNTITEIEVDSRILSRGTNYLREYAAIHRYFDENNLKKYEQDDEGMFLCHFCKKKFKYKNQIRHHLYTSHMTVKPFNCSICDKGFKTKDHLQRHVRTHTDERPYSCEACGNRFRQQHHLTQHMRVHEDGSSGVKTKLVKPREEELEEEELAAIPNLDYCIMEGQSDAMEPVEYDGLVEEEHIATEEQSMEEIEMEDDTPLEETCNDEEQYTPEAEIYTPEDEQYTPEAEEIDQTDIIETAATAEADIEQVIEAETISHNSIVEVAAASYEEEYEAIHRYFYDNNLEKYQQNEAGLYVCHFCDKTFVYKNHVRQHLSRTHMSAKPHICEICTKGFKSKDCLKRHVRTHTDERPFSCDTCGNKFRQQHHLSAHLKVHQEAETVSSPAKKAKLMRVKVELAGQARDDDASLIGGLLVNNSLEAYQAANAIEIHNSSAETSMEEEKVASAAAASRPPTAGATALTGLLGGTYEQEYDAIHTYFKDNGLNKYQQDTNGKYICHFCDTKLRGKCEIRKHLYMVHMTVRPHDCDVCGKAFKIKYQLEEHKRSHIYAKN